MIDLTCRERLHTGFDVRHRHVLILVAIKGRYANCELERSDASPTSAVACHDSYRNGLVAHRRPVAEDAIRSRDEASYFAVQEARQIRRPIDPRLTVCVQSSVARLAALLASLSGSSGPVYLNTNCIHF
jgi:hypothetical protein